MCIKIVTAKREISYDMAKPLEEQLRGSKKIVVNYEPSDPCIDKFLDEVERLCKNGISANVNITFNHGNNLKGAKIKKKLNNISDDLNLNEVIKMMAIAHSETDKKLEEIANYCMDGEREQQKA